MHMTITSNQGKSFQFLFLSEAFKATVGIVSGILQKLRYSCMPTKTSPPSIHPAIYPSIRAIKNKNKKSKFRKKKKSDKKITKKINGR